MDMHYLKIFILLYALEWREDILTIFAALFGYLLIVTPKKISVVSVIRVDARVRRNGNVDILCFLQPIKCLQQKF